eukprot:GHVU01135193.1.p1 GENE.GHVU01135193.1~~GHVU01135193.1.p1  ORF type:complete len:112 (+),score=10.19 GHVU01135193.1:57-392(+)
MANLGRLVKLGSPLRFAVPRLLQNPAIKQRVATLKTSTNRLGHDVTWYYRQGNFNPPNFAKYGSEVVMAVMWYWVLWHCWYHWDSVVGHFTIPNSSQWTDEELGIPPDDEE